MIPYTPREKGDTDGSDLGIALEVSQALDPKLDAVDVALVILPPDEGGYFEYEIPYGELKEILGERGIPSQMIYRDSFGSAFTHRNVALGLLAAAGGVPFTVEDRMPGSADLFIGIDVGVSFRDDAADQHGIRVGASMTAIYADGTILGYANTGAQLGERVPPQDLRKIVRQVVTGYQHETGEQPNHIVIHRDGFLNEDLGVIEDYLSGADITYDLVEIRKQTPARIVNCESTVGYQSPKKGVAVISENEPRAMLATFGLPETLAENGTPRPITVEHKAGPTAIETLAKQVYLLSQSHIGVHNTTGRLPITTAYADKASEAAAKGHLPQTTQLETGISFI